MTPFDNIESTREYVSLLAQAIDLSLAEVEADLALAGDDRRREALRLTIFNMNRLRGHISSSLGILDNLRTLRQLMIEERLAKVYGQGAA